MTTAALPPSYSFGSATASRVDISQPLPQYTYNTSRDWDIPAAQQEHSFPLKAKKTGAQWLTLTITSRAKSEAEIPVFYQSADITGTLRLELDKEETIDEVTIALYGRLSIFSHSSANFLYMSRTLYSASDKTSDISRKRGRLNGEYVWPYSFRLPKGVSIMSAITIDCRAERNSYRLPPSFSDEEANIDVTYYLAVRVSRGGLRSGSKLSVPIRYLPIQRPSPPTILRQLAYQENIPVVGPEGDPEGWKTLPSVSIEGTLFKTITAHVRCTLSISRPLSFTRGTPIHLTMLLESENEQLLDLISSQGIHLSLIQRTTFGEPNQRTRFSQRLSEQVTIKTRERGVASWWRFPHPTSLNSQRMLAGEVLVPDDLVPACSILHYGHEYELALYPPSAVGFTPNTSPKKALLTESVIIVTAYAKTATPRSYIPPDYGTL